MTLIPTCVVCEHCSALLLALEYERDEDVGLVCRDRGRCAARIRAQASPPPALPVAWEASSARRQRERMQSRAVRRGRAA